MAVSKYSALKQTKKKPLPPPTAAFMEEIGTRAEKTQRGNTTSYLVFEEIVKDWIQKHKRKKPVIVDIGAGKGVNVKNLEEQNIPVIAVEPTPNEQIWGDRTPDYSYSSEVPSNIADLILNSFVLNVVTTDIAEGIVEDIHRILKPKGQAVIFVRTVSDVETGAKAYIHPEYGELSWGAGHKVTTSLTYQRGFTYDTLLELISSCCSFSKIERISVKSGIAVEVTK